MARVPGEYSQLSGYHLCQGFWLSALLCLSARCGLFASSGGRFGGPGSVLGALSWAGFPPSCLQLGRGGIFLLNLDEVLTISYLLLMQIMVESGGGWAQGQTTGAFIRKVETEP